MQHLVYFRLRCSFTFMISPAFSAIVRCKDIYEYFVEKGDLKLWVDPLFKQGARKVTSGIVHSPPASMPPSERIGNPLRTKDKVYFHYNALDESSLIPETKGLFLIPMDMIFCYVRKGRITPLDGKIFCRPYFDPDVVEIELDGGITTMARQSRFGIITEINVKHNYKRAIVAHIGPPLKGAPALDLKAGDNIYYATDGDFENTIEGERYFVMDQDLVLAKQ